MGIKNINRTFALIIYYFIAKHIPTHNLKGVPDVGGRIRKKLCANIFGSCGKNLFIENGVDFGQGRKLFVGNDVTIKRGVQINLNEKVRIGNNSYIGEEAIIYTQDHGHFRKDIPMQKQPYLRRPVMIGDEVKIGPRCIVLKGASINNGAIVGPGSVVSGNIQEKENVIGIPAKKKI